MNAPKPRCKTLVVKHSCTQSYQCVSKLLCERAQLERMAKLVTKQASIMKWYEIHIAYRSSFRRALTGPFKNFATHAWRWLRAASRSKTSLRAYASWCAPAHSLCTAPAHHVSTDIDLHHEVGTHKRGNAAQTIDLHPFCSLLLLLLLLCCVVLPYIRA